jgi:hypothetical protein
MLNDHTLNYLVDDVLRAPDHVSYCLYSVALAALVPGPHQNDCIEWLIENYEGIQKESATLSWQHLYISSYAMALAFREVGQTDFSDSILGTLSANQNHDAQTETLTFGGLVGALDRYAQHRFGLNVTHNQPVQHAIKAEMHKWNKMSKWEHFLNPSFSIAGYGAECLYGLPIDLDAFSKVFQYPDGSIVRSPSASVMIYLSYQHAGKTPPPGLLEYIHTLNPYHQTIGIFQRLENFLIAWLLLYMGDDAQRIRHLPEVEEMHMALYRNPCIGAAATMIAPDLDTGTAAMVAVNMDMNDRIKAFKHIDSLLFNTVYRTLLFELNPSITTNIHVLAAWPENPNADSVLSWLSEVMDGTFKHWVCKWHISPYYTFGEIARLFVKIPHPKAHTLANRALYMLLASQRKDGGWGELKSTTEETGYSVLALIEHHHKGTPLCNEIESALKNAIPILEREPDYTPLWIGKTLYCLRPLVRALRVIARERIREVIGQ